MLVAEAVGKALASLGVDTVFGVVGSGNFHVTNALIAGGARFVATRHECGAATMADAYPRTSRKVAAITLHQGCGLTNAMTGITEAAKSRTPLLVLAADTAAGAVRSNFRVDQDALAVAVGAVPERVHSPLSAVADAARALRTAVEQRRTVVLNLPLDVQAAECPAGALEVPAAPALKPPRPSPEAVAKGLFNGNPWYLDVSGGFATPLAAELISGADLVVGWGCALNMWTMRHGALIGPDAAVVQVDLDSDAIGAHRPVDLGMVGDVDQTALAVTDELAARGFGAVGYRSDALRARIAAEGRWRDVPYQDESDGGRIDPRSLSIALDDLLPAERVLAIDSGNFMGYPSMFLSVPDDDGFCFTQAFQSIGLGLFTAVGAALAQPQRLPVAALGDGGALMAIAELETVVRLGLPVGGVG